MCVIERDNPALILNVEWRTETIGTNGSYLFVKLAKGVGSLNFPRDFLQCQNAAENFTPIKKLKSRASTVMLIKIATHRREFVVNIFVR